jgi:hypothetical protein
MEAWHDLFIAVAGAAGALLGLIFVAISISVDKILERQHMSQLTFQPISLLLGILFISIFVLIPQQSATILGIEILLSAIVLWWFNMRSDLAVYRQLEPEKKKYYHRNIVFSQLTILPFLAAGILEITTGNIGLYLTVPGIMFSFIKATLNSWGILVELNRKRD